MFNLSGNRVPSEGAIRNANEHLLLLNQRVAELQQRVLEQKELLERREFEHVQRLRQLKAEKDAELSLMHTELHQHQKRLIEHEEMIRERDLQVAFLMHRCSYLDEAASYAPLLDQLARCLKNAFIKPMTPAPSKRPEKEEEVPTKGSSSISKSESTTPILTNNNNSTDRGQQQSSMAVIRTRPIL